MDLHSLLQQAQAAGASDLHLSAGLPPTLRVDGGIQALDATPLDAQALGELLAELGLPAAVVDDRDFAYAHDQCGRWRGHLFQQQRGPALALRHIAEAIPDFQQLGLDDRFRQLVERPQGLVLLCGATGSGKSTTLAAMLDHLNRNCRRHILTLEDPIEYIHRPRCCLISQRQVGRDVASFDEALRSALRADPDVILVGELRDRQTIRLALTAAETGHLVLATLHALSAAKAIDRLLDAFSGEDKLLIRNMLSESLQAVVAQALLPACPGGRVAVHEILLATPAVRNLIREGKLVQLSSCMQAGRGVGMQTQDMALQALRAAGRIA